MREAKDCLALALDNVSDLAALGALVDRTRESVGVYKVGLEQFVRFGPSVIDAVRRDGCAIFLDLKLHDIPNTVAKAVSSACEHGVDYLTIHTTGGVEMMRAAAEAAAHARAAGKTAPRLLGVTVLTSISAECLREELRVPAVPADHVRHLAGLAVQSGLDGIVCSAADLPNVTDVVPEGFTVVTPGIRPSGAAVNDQKRVTTPADAIRGGATMLVVGRPITGAGDPGRAARAIVEEIAAGLVPQG